MKKIIFITFLILLCNYLNAQVSIFSWARGISGNLNQTPTDVISDAAGNVYTVGWFEGNADFDPGTGTLNMACVGVRDIFITKFDALGNFSWAKQIGGVSSDAANALVLDSQGNLIITGYYVGIIDFDPGPATFTLNTSNSGSNSFILKLNSAGNFIWAKNITGNNTVTASDIALASNGDIVLTGNFQGTIDFDPSAATSNITAFGSSDIFILRLDFLSNFIWVNRMGGTDREVSNAVAINYLGLIFITGKFKGTCNFQPYGNNTPYTFSTSNSNSQVFVAAYQPNGDLHFAERFLETTSDFNEGLGVTTCSNSVYFTGTILGPTIIQPIGVGNNGNTVSLNTNGSGDIFIIKFSWQGALLGAKSIGALGYDFGTSIICPNDTIVRLTGSFVGNVDFNPSAATFNLNSAGSNDAFILNLNSDLDFKWAGKMGGTAYDSGNAIYEDASNNIYLAGFYQATGNFNPLNGTSNLSWQNGTDCYVVKLAPCTIPIMPVNITPNLNLIFCANLNTTLSASSSHTINWYSSSASNIGISSGSTFTTPSLTAGTYTYYAEAFSCAASASRTAITFTVNPLPNISASSSQSLLCLGNSATLTAFGVTSYTWNTGSNANNIVISPTITSSFSVIGTNTNGCSNAVIYNQLVADCSTGLASRSSTNSLKLYPNPSNGNFIIETSKPIDINIINILGQTILTQRLNDAKTDIDINLEPNGLYFIKTDSSTFKIIKN